MAPLRLSFALRNNPTVQAVFDGSVGIEGVELTISSVTPPDLFWRQLQYAEFDISEMSMSSLLMNWTHGDDRFTPIPVFPERRFFHTRMIVRRDAGIDSPKDLVGKRIAVPDYQQTAALWTRGYLQHDFGVSPEDIVWFGERTKELSHAGATGFTPPSSVRFEHIPASSSQAAMLRSGELDGSVLYLWYRTMLDRTVGAPPAEIIRPLFEDVPAEGRRAYEKWGFIPFNHCYVIRTELVRQHPWLALNAYRAFVAAKDAYYAELEKLVEPYALTGLLPGTSGALSTDLFPYGIRQNERALSNLAEFAHEQGLIESPVDIREMFAEATRGL